MRLLSLWATASVLLSSAIAFLVPAEQVEKEEECVVKPKVFIVSMFDAEADVWYGIPEFDLLAMNVTVPGFSPQFPDAHCTADGEVCQLTTGMGEINAAVTLTSLVHSSRFDLSTTYMLIAGIGGVNPEITTLASVTLARYAVQVALQHEFDPRDLPANYSTGYIPIGATVPGEYPSSIYGTEVFELNANLQHAAAAFARNASLSDSATAAAYRANYAASPLYAAATQTPSVIECDSATSDVYYSGTRLSSAFSEYTTLLTNGTGVYCSSAQEDNATLEALLRGAAVRKVDFSRVIAMRTGSNFERPYPGQAATDNLFYAQQGGLEPATQNLYLAGREIIAGVLEGWNSTFARGVNATNYVGDILATLGGEPDFGPVTFGADLYGSGE